MDRNWEERWGVETSASLAGKKPAPTHGTFKHQVPRQSRNKCTEESWPEILRYLVYSLTGFNHNPMVEGGWSEAEGEGFSQQSQLFLQGSNVSLS